MANVARVRSGILPTGFAVFFLGLGCLIVGWFLGWRELIIISTGSALLALFCVPWIIGRFPLEMSRDIDPPRASRNEKAIAVLTAHNPTSKPIAAKSVEDRVGDLVVPVRLPVLLPNQHFELPYELPTQNRGAFPLGPVSMVRADPVGLYRRERTHGNVNTFWVHPDIVQLATMPTGLARDMEGPTSQNSPAGGIAFHTLREYELGDDYRHIHWRSTAKTGTLMVRHYVDNRRPHLTAVLDDRRSSYASDDEFELAVSAAASIVATGLRSGYPVAGYSLTSDFSVLAPRSHQDDWMDRFSEVTQADDESLTDLVYEASQRNSGSTLFTLVTGSKTADELFGLVSLVRSAQRKLIVRAQLRSAEQIIIPGSVLADISTGEELKAVWAQIVRS